MLETTDPDVFAEMRRWCEGEVDADTEVTRTESFDGTEVMECQISTDRETVVFSLDERRNGKVLLDDDCRRSPSRTGYEQDWEGDVQTLDLHSDGVTLAGESASFSLHWGDH